MIKRQSAFFIPILLLSFLFILQADISAETVLPADTNRPDIRLMRQADTPAKPVMYADTSRPDTSTFPLGEKVEVSFGVIGITDNQQLRLILEVHNEFGVLIDKPEPVLLSVKADGTADYIFSAPANLLGYYEIKAHLSNGTVLHGLGTRPAGIISYAVVPDPALRIDYGDTGSRFGLQGGYSSSALVIPYLGVRYMLSGNNWEKMEPDQPGQFFQERTAADRDGKRHPPKATEYEKPIFNGREWTTYHISTVSSASLPSWALKAGTSGTICKQFGELNDVGLTALPEFALAHAKAFFSDYQNQNYRYYQVTWEPGTGWCYGGSPAGLVQIYKQCYDAIHQGDPHAIVAGPTLFINKESSAQLDALWSAGLSNYIDALSFHPYVLAWPPEKNGMPTILKEQLQAAKMAKGAPIRFMGTEQGFTSSDNGNLKKAMGDIRLTLMMLGEGADVDFGFYIADFWEGDDLKINKGYGYYWNLNPKINFGTDKLGPKISVPAYAAMTYFLDGTTSKGPLTDTSGSQIGYSFQKNDTIIYVVWDYATSSTYKVPTGTNVCNWMGNCSKATQSNITIGGTPTYFIKGNVP